MALNGIDLDRWMLGLERVRAALDILGHPENHYPHILVGGTNGKGSTCIYLESLLINNGFKTGVTLSPHVSYFNERFRINGRDATSAEITETESELRFKLKDVDLTYFEWTLIIAARLFQKNEVDFAVFEIGLGGRLDAANALDPCISLITNISLDHMDYLGDTISQIAAEKACIARPGRPLLTTAQEGLDVIINHADSIGAKLIRVENCLNYSPGIEGKGQYLNASLAVRAFEELGLKMSDGGIKTAVSNAFLPGRIERAGRVILDVAHNGASMVCLCEHLEKTGFRGIGVLGILKDKDFMLMTDILLKVCPEINLAPVKSQRSWGRDEMIKASGKGKAGIFSSLEGAFDNAVKKHSDVVVTGSFYTVGEIRERLICRGWR